MSKDIIEKFKKKIKLCWLVLKDKRTPKSAKVLIAFAIISFLFPFNIFPTFLTSNILGDLAIIIIIIIIAIKIIPEEIIDDYKNKIKCESQNEFLNQAKEYFKGTKITIKKKSKDE